MGVCRLTGKYCDGSASRCRVFRVELRSNSMCYHYREGPRLSRTETGADLLVREARRILA